MRIVACCEIITHRFNNDNSCLSFSVTSGMARKCDTPTGQRTKTSTTNLCKRWWNGCRKALVWCKYYPRQHKCIALAKPRVSLACSNARFPALRHGSSWWTCAETVTIHYSIGVARILSGVHFFAKKSWRPFFSRHPQRLSKSTSICKPHSKNCIEIDSYSGWGCTSCPGGALTHFPVN